MPPSPPTPSSGSAVAGRFRALSGSSTTQPPPWSATATSTGRSTATVVLSVAAWAFTTTGRSPTSRRDASYGRTSALPSTLPPWTRPSREPSRKSPVAVALPAHARSPAATTRASRFDAQTSRARRSGERRALMRSGSGYGVAVFAGLKVTLRSVIVAVNPVESHFFDSVVILPMSFTRSPVLGSSVVPLWSAS